MKPSPLPLHPLPLCQIPPNSNERMPLTWVSVQSAAGSREIEVKEDVQPNERKLKSLQMECSRRHVQPMFKRRALHSCCHVRALSHASTIQMHVVSDLMLVLFDETKGMQSL